MHSYTNVPATSSTRVSSRRPAPPRSSGNRNISGLLHQYRPLIYAAALTAAVLILWAIGARIFAPTSNTALTHFDTIIVLGTPADPDGNPTPTMLSHVNEAVREYEHGVAAHIILTGGAAHNRFVEAQVMNRIAQAQGIPSSAILVEPEAHNTIQNACYSVRIMQARGWHSAEVITGPAHLPRAGLIFNKLPIEWRTHAAPPPEANSVSMEILKTVHLLVLSQFTEHCEP